jgi:hypothetical protein
MTMKKILQEAVAHKGEDLFLCFLLSQLKGLAGFRYPEGEISMLGLSIKDLFEEVCFDFFPSIGILSLLFCEASSI